MAKSLRALRREDYADFALANGETSGGGPWGRPMTERLEMGGRKGRPYVNLGTRVPNGRIGPFVSQSVILCTFILAPVAA